jgi:DNA polymerase-3 subunit delta'
MLFKNVIGQSTAKSLLKRMADNDRIPHALLLLGMPGSGGLPLALSFAQYVLCENKVEGDACGSCRSCLKTSKSIHPDLHFSFPTVGTNVTSDHYLENWRQAIADNPYFDVNQWLQLIGVDNKQGNINKEECSQIMRKLSLKIFEGNYKIMLIWLPEYLGKEGNRLLKLIEEPPDNTLLLLVAENQELILNTILSRCQLVKVPALSDEEVEQGLMQIKKMPLEKARPIAQLAGGNFNEALNIADQPESDNSSLFLEWMRKCYIGNGIELVNWVEEFAKLGRENQKQFLQYGLHFMREYMTLKMAGADNGLDIRLLPKERTTAENLTKVIGFDQIGRIVGLFDDCAFAIERNANQKILFLDASIKLNKILRR